MRLVLLFKSKRKWPKMAKAKTVQENAYMRFSETKGSEAGQSYAESSKRELLRRFLFLFYLLMQRDLQ